MYNTYDYENSQAFPAFKHSAVNMYGGTEMKLHTLSLITMVLDGNECISFTAQLLYPKKK